jgi:hypothetical protein
VYGSKCGKKSRHVDEKSEFDFRDIFAPFSQLSHTSLPTSLVPMDDDPYYQDDADALEAINQLEDAQEHEDIAEVEEPPAAAEVAQPPGPNSSRLVLDKEDDDDVEESKEEMRAKLKQSMQYVASRLIADRCTRLVSLSMLL